MPLNIKYSLKLERQRVNKTIKKLPWYGKLGYSPRFPENINPKIDSLKKIHAALLDEYNEIDYKKAAMEINKKFSAIEKNFSSNLQKICGKKIRKNFQLILTKYGVGGSYSSPDKIIYNIGMKSSSINTIFHEITHLVIEPNIKKYQIQQNEKERIVDLILTSKPIALTDYKMQKRGKDCGKIIDPLFKKYFKPPINNFFKKLTELRYKI
jgi:hypothetical protein